MRKSHVVPVFTLLACTLLGCLAPAVCEDAPKEILKIEFDVSDKSARVVKVSTSAAE